MTDTDLYERYQRLPDDDLHNQYESSLSSVLIEVSNLVFFLQSNPITAQTNSSEVMARVNRVHIMVTKIERYVKMMLLSALVLNERARKRLKSLGDNEKGTMYKLKTSEIKSKAKWTNNQE